ncbi:glycerophosphodiester phosphodiesterase [Alphaproteobacteria bacterium KMM 3653]|uniref:Glycerophosphodiester phosphodiesterase n=1 Tax=Harenicola maris TaxID=2841044 RepID=A0AAP2G962_9RHOB|nr:glycerophosphodiester phosphodiesterase [Harenicola maris]
MTRIASHRGGTLNFGDSTPTGFRATAALPLEEVEFDIHPSRDGAIMVHHDATLDRTTDSSGALIDRTEAEIRAASINYGVDEHPISLAELCGIYKDSAVTFRCEFKPDQNGMPYAGFVPKAIEELSRHGMLERTGFSSFMVANLEEIARHTSRPFLWLVSPPVQKQLGIKAMIELAQAHRIPEIGLNIDHTDAATMEQITKAGLDFGCWAAHSEAQITKALSLGVKVFTTDRPLLAIEVRKSFHKEAAA